MRGLFLWPWMAGTLAMQEQLPVSTRDDAWADNAGAIASVDAR
jgi:hypothetical protein